MLDSSKTRTMLDDHLAQIQQASAAGLYYVALFSALALPDICGALESTDGMATGSRYAAWFDKNVAPRYHGFLDGETCYRFRCSLLHQASTQHPKSQYSRILFVEPTATSNVFHNNILNDALNIDVRLFCQDMVESVSAWLTTAQNLPEFVANQAKCVRRYPGGLKPYIVGMPVIG